MKKVIIVEDEKLVLWGINSLFEGQNEFELTGSFSQGKEAYAFICKNPPDILLTDIKMPQMDGLTLIREVKTLFPHIKVVVLSFFGDYDFVHKAFKLGIDDYILKHKLERDSLLSVLKSVTADEDNNSGKNEKSQPRLDFNVLLHERLGEPDDECRRLRKLFENRYPEFKSGKIIFAVLKLKREFDNNFKLIPRSTDNNLLFIIVRKILDASGAGRVFLNEDRNILMLLEGSSDFEDKRKSFFAELNKELSLYLNVSFFIGKSDVLALHEIDVAYKQANSSLDSSFYHQNSRILSYNSEMIERDGERFMITDPSKLMLAMDPDWKNDINRIFTDAMRFKPPSDEFCSDLFRLWEALEFWFRDTFSIELEEKYSTFLVFKIIDDIDDIERLKSWCFQIIEMVRKRICNIVNKTSKIGEMSNYIRDNYYKDLTLACLSDKFNLNPSYISEILKKELDCGFSKYLTRVRVEEAKKLLISGHDTSEEICFKVGFNSPSHFSKVFKKQTKMTTTSYRNQFQKILNNNQ